MHPTNPVDPVVVPIFQSTTYAQRAPGEHGDFEPGGFEHGGFTYSRAHNPTVSALEDALARFEVGAPEPPGGDSPRDGSAPDPDPVHATAYSTGMAAITTLALSLLEGGGHAVCSEVVYGGTVRLFEEVLRPFGVSVSFVDSSDPDAVLAALGPTTRLVLVESPGNPTLRLTDLEATAAIAHRHGALLAVDNTFLTAALQRPFDRGADVVVYSTTKFIEGHNSALGGALLVRDFSLHQRLDRVRKTLGTIQTPLGAWLTLQGLKTLPLRIERHSRTARAVATWLEDRPEVGRVLYPGLESFPQHDLARRLGLCRPDGGGGLVSFEVEDAPLFLRSLDGIRVAENLGAVETLATHPASMTHGDLDPQRRRRLGISEGLVRLSVGLEPAAELIADLERGLRALTAGTSGSRPREVSA